MLKVNLGTAPMSIAPPQQLVSTIQNNQFFFKRDAQIVFVCGRALTSKDSKRKIVLEYASRHIPEVHLLLAEDFFNTFLQTDIDILSIESKMSAYADCIMIILESESAYCELGAFAIDDSLAKKMLIINDTKFEKSLSFINNGPLKKIEKQKDEFAGVIYVNMESILSCASEIQNRLKKLATKKLKRIKFSTFEDFKLNSKERLLFLCDIVNLLSPITYKELIYLFKTIYHEQNFNFLHFDLRMLQTLNLIKRVEHTNNETYFLRNEIGMKFVSINFSNEIKIRSSSFISYKKKDPNRLDLLGC